MAYGHWDFYDIEEVCETATESPTVEPTNEPTLEPSLSPTIEPTLEPSLSPTSEPSLKPSSSPTIEPTRDVCTLGTMTAGGIGDRSALLDRKYFKFDDQTAYDDYASAGSQYWHNGLGRTTYVSQTSLWPQGCMNACCANPACQSFMFYKGECLLYSVATSAGMDDILGHSSRQGPWGINAGGPGYSIAFWEMSRQPSPPIDAIPDVKFYLKVEDYTSGNAWVDRVSNVEVNVPGSASFHEGYVHLSGTAITAPLRTNPNYMQSVTYVIRLRVPTIPSNLGWVMSQFPDHGWSRALTISDYRLGTVGQTPGYFGSGLGSFLTDSWQVLVGTWTQGGACRTILQGTSGNTRICSNGAGNDSNEKLIIGGRGETDAGHNPGSIDISDVLVFNRVLNNDEIKFITSTLSEPKLTSSPTVSEPTNFPTESPTTIDPTRAPSKSPTNGPTPSPTTIDPTR